MPFISGDDDARTVVFGILQSPPKSLNADLDVNCDEHQEKIAENTWIVDLKILAAQDIVERQYVHQKRAPQ